MPLAARQEHVLMMIFSTKSDIKMWKLAGNAFNTKMLTVVQLAVLSGIAGVAFAATKP